MIYDKFGQPYISTTELSDLLYDNPELDISNISVIDPEIYNNAVKQFYLDYPKLKAYQPITNISIEEFDQTNQANWFMPKQYQDLDISTYVLNLCKTDRERERVKIELDLFQKYKFEQVLRYLLYLVDSLKRNQIVWGIGRGSSVASYVLYLIGVHKINSLEFNLDIHEFLK